MSDLTDRLRVRGEELEDNLWSKGDETLFKQAADELDRQAAEIERLRADAGRYRALRRNTGHEVDLSSGPGSPKNLIIRINCTGCERYFESGAPDYLATLDTALDDEIRLQEGVP